MSQEQTLLTARIIASLNEQPDDWDTVVTKDRSYVRNRKLHIDIAVQGGYYVDIHDSYETTGIPIRLGWLNQRKIRKAAYSLIVEKTQRRFDRAELK